MVCGQITNKNMQITLVSKQQTSPENPVSLHFEGDGVSLDISDDAENTKDLVVGQTFTLNVEPLTTPVPQKEVPPINEGSSREEGGTITPPTS